MRSAKTSLRLTRKVPYKLIQSILLRGSKGTLGDYPKPPYGEIKRYL
jgi:hypothetical protein